MSTLNPALEHLIRKDERHRQGAYKAVIVEVKIDHSMKEALNILTVIENVLSITDDQNYLWASVDYDTLTAYFVVSQVYILSYIGKPSTPSLTEKFLQKLVDTCKTSPSNLWKITFHNLP